MERFTDEEIMIAKAVDLVDLAGDVMIPLCKKGSYYQVEGMSSAMIFNRTSWCRFSRGEGGSTIDFLMYFKDMEFKEAVEYLLNYAGYIKTDIPEKKRDTKQLLERLKSNPKKEKQAKKPFILPKRSDNCRRVYAYLIKNRRLSKRIIQHWMKEELMYESLPHHNIVFLGKDPQGKVRFASQRGTADCGGKTFKLDVAGNDKTFGVNIVKAESSEINVYEAAIDAMSDMDFRSDYKTNILVLGMVSDGPLEKLLDAHKHIHTVSISLDNDMPGRAAAKKMARKYVLKDYEVYLRLPPFGKDYNAFLQCERENRELYEQLLKVRGKEKMQTASENPGKKKAVHDIRHEKKNEKPFAFHKGDIRKAEPFRAVSGR